MLKLIPDSTRSPLRHPWKNLTTVGRAYDLLREDVLAHMRKAQRDIGYKYCRFHGLFHDDMGVVKQWSDGTRSYQWHHVDKVLDALLEMGLHPFIELNPMPSLLASGKQTMFYYKMNVTPPRNYSDWEDLVEKFTEHCIERYGLDEVRQWYFEVWNEPNLAGFWSGTQEEYWLLYEHAAKAVKRCDSQLRIGGPATSKASWIAEIIEHCHSHHLPLDFVSTHLYPQDEYVLYQDRKGSPHAIGEFFSDNVKTVQQTVKNSSMPDLEIHWTEWNPMSTTATDKVSWLENECVDSLFGASFIVRNCIELDQSCDSFGYWIVSDIFEEAPIPNAPFSCTYGLLTNTGIPKATYNAFKFLKAMRGNTLTVEGSTPQFCGIHACREGKRTLLLLWQHRPLEINSQPDWQDSIVLPDFDKDAHTVTSARITAHAGSAWESWLAMGRPQNPTNQQQQLLRQHAQPRHNIETLTPHADGAALPFTLASNEVLLIEIAPKAEYSHGKVFGNENWGEWDDLMSDQSK